jgi:hypothetical protein
VSAIARLSYDSTTHASPGSTVAASGGSARIRRPQAGESAWIHPAGPVPGESASVAGQRMSASADVASVPRGNVGEPVHPDLARAMRWAAEEEARLAGQLELAPDPDTEPTEVVRLPWTAPDPVAVAAYRAAQGEGTAAHWRQDAVGALLAAGWRPDREQAERMGSSRAVRTQRWLWEER